MYIEDMFVIFSIMICIIISGALCATLYKSITSDYPRTDIRVTECILEKSKNFKLEFEFYDVLLISLTRMILKDLCHSVGLTFAILSTEKSKFAYKFKGFTICVQKPEEAYYNELKILIFPSEKPTHISKIIIGFSGYGKVFFNEKDILVFSYSYGQVDRYESSSIKSKLLSDETLLRLNRIAKFPKDKLYMNIKNSRGT